MNKYVNTVTGSLNTADMGFTLAHEHVMTSPLGVYRDYPSLMGEKLIERIVDDLKHAKAGGIDTIVDATPFDIGREVNIMAEASRRSGVNIIACTGWWLIPFIPWAHFEIDSLKELFINDIEKGIAGTNIKAGILKAASDAEGVTEWQANVLRAVARAQIKTGVPIMLHSYAARQVARQQLAILKEEKVDLRMVKVDHVNDTTDIEYLLWLLQQGCYLGLDRYPGLEGGLNTLERTRTLKALIEAGYADYLCLSHDRMIPITPIIQVHLESPNPHGFLYIKKVVLPLLKEMGVADPVISNLCVRGPRNYFEGR